MNDKEIIEIKDIVINFNDYYRILIGTPVWWYTMTPPIRSFLNKYKNELANKYIQVFATNGGWLGHTIEEINEYVKVNNYVNLEFDGKNIRNDSKERLNNFIKNL